jgi:Icc-related predicted phosphoesterase
VKILALSDQVVDRLYDLIPTGHFGDIDLIVGCGDLPYEYLEHMVSALNLDLVYVPGNHDPAYNPAASATFVHGGTNLDLKTIRFRGLSVAGFGGSIRYRPNAPNQYSQSDGYVRAASLAPRLILNRLRYGRSLDVLITHSPPLGIHDDDSAAHRGLEAINWLIRWARPSLHLHGHMHDFRRNLKPDRMHLGATSILNVFPYRVVEIPDVG